jgi:hypothetical protein
MPPALAKHEPAGKLAEFLTADAVLCAKAGQRRQLAKLGD